jgi:hypothetical protein
MDQDPEEEVRRHILNLQPPDGVPSPNQGGEIGPGEQELKSDSRAVDCLLSPVRDLIIRKKDEGDRESEEGLYFD